MPHFIMLAGILRLLKYNWLLKWDYNGISSLINFTYLSYHREFKFSYTFFKKKLGMFIDLFLKVYSRTRLRFMCAVCFEIYNHVLLNISPKYIITSFYICLNVIELICTSTADQKKKIP